MPLIDGQNCPVCNVKMFNGDEDVAYCPICGAPHHKDCYLSLGHCALEDKHGQPQPEVDQTKEEPQQTPPIPPPYNYHPGKQASPGIEHDRVGGNCPRCGRLCTSDTLFCPYCGLDLNRYKNAWNGQQPPGFSPPYMPFSPPAQADPLGGVDPTADIDGVPVADMAGFVAQNTRRYLPRFVKFSKEKSRVSTNWGAFFFPEYWFFFRKLYLPGCLILMLSIAAGVLIFPLLLALPDPPEGLGGGYWAAYDWIAKHVHEIRLSAVWFALAGIAAQLLLRLFCLLFADIIYKNHCVKTIQSIKADTEVEDAHAEILKKGGLSLFAPLGAMFASYWINIIISGIIAG